MAKQKYLHQKAANNAKQFLVRKYYAEYQALYRAQVLAMGGSVHPSREERIAKLKLELALLEGKGV